MTVEAPKQANNVERNVQRIPTTSVAEEAEYRIVFVQQYQSDPLEARYGLTLPSQLIKRYAMLAAQRAEAEQLQDGSWYAEIPGFPGVWAQGKSEAEVVRELETVVRDWALLKIQDKDRDLPIIGLIDLNVL